MKSFYSKKPFADMLLNIAAAGMPVFVLQIIIYPQIAKHNELIYSLVITLYSLITIISDPFGKSVNNIRLINNNEDENKKGDFNILIVLFSLLTVVIMSVGVIFYSSQVVLLRILLISITSVLFLFNTYSTVFFRINLNYYAIFLNSLIMSCGFIVGFLLYRSLGIWELIFLTPHLMCFIYLGYKTNFLAEPFIITKRFKKRLIDSTLLSFSVFLSQGMSLADKLLLLPLVGSGPLARYYAASVLGKLIVLATGPINSVILTYLSKHDKLSNTLFKKYILICALTCTILGGVVLLIGRYVLLYLYPMYYDEAIVLLPLTTLNTLIYVMGSMVTPIVMRYCNLSWQVTSNFASFMIYIISSVVLLTYFGIVGFCIGVGIGHLTKLIVLLFAYNRFVQE